MRISAVDRIILGQLNTTFIVPVTMIPVFNISNPVNDCVVIILTSHTVHLNIIITRTKSRSPSRKYIQRDVLFLSVIYELTSLTCHSIETLTELYIRLKDIVDR